MDSVYDDLALERTIKEQFGFAADIAQVIVREIDISPTSQATVLLTNKKQLLVYIHGQSRLLLGDVKKLVSRMGFKAELFIPPAGKPNYFDTIGRAKFRDVFPGRSHASEEDIIFYRTLAPYNPALVLISEVKDGAIYCYDSDARGKWRVAAKFAYRRIKTS